MDFDAWLATNEPDGPIEPMYNGRFDPVHPCRVQSTRHCPAVYDGTCDELGQVCARFESRDELPWLPEMPIDFNDYDWS